MVFRYGDRIAEALGIEPKGRQLNVETLFLSTEKNPGAYWLQLLVATGIAHMGLILDSTAVLIGAMLISPLMSPIVQVGMGFAIGHLHLALRAGRRLLTSILVVILLSALTSWLAPFSQPTAQILGRTQPTILDLVVALFCGLAAAFTTARGSKDTVTAAAGTAIAIALVPPLCVVGFGVGTGVNAIRDGASLLFVANLAAIILVGDLFFLLTGFARTDLERLEQRVYDEDDKAKGLYRFAKWLPVPAGVSRSLSLRLLLPVTFVTLVSVPLSQALSQVLWQVQVKGAVVLALDAFEKDYRVIQRVLTVAPDAVTLRMSVVGEPEQREAIEEGLRMKLAAASGLEKPSVTVDVVPDVEAVRRRLKDSSQKLAQQIANLQAPPPKECPPAPEPVDVKALKAEARAAGAADALKGQSATEHLSQVHATVAKVLGWAAPKPPPDSAWLGWSLATGPTGVTLTLELLSDAPVAAGLADTLANVVRHETGLALSVAVRQVPRTVWDTAEVPDVAELPRALAPLKAHGLTVECAAPDPEQARGRAKARIQAARAALEAAGMAPTPGERWLVRAVLPASNPFAEAK